MAAAGGPERLQKLIAAAGHCSRRGAEALLREGRVQLNGRTARLGERADPRRDRILVAGRPLGSAPEPLVLLLNKPIRVLSTCRDPRGRATVLDLVPAALRQGRGLHPVGRLDADSRGALLLTNQGELTLRLTHPRYGHPKTYRVWVEGHPGQDALARWRLGIQLDGRPTAPVAVRILRSRPDASCLEVVMGEGRNRQIRRTAAALGHAVVDLQRLAIGGLALDGLREGAWRRLDRQEWQHLLQQPC